MKIGFGVSATEGARLAQGARGVLCCCLAASLLIACASLSPSGQRTGRPAPPAAIALLVSDDVPAFTDVEKEIVRRFSGRVETYSVARTRDRNALRARVQRSDATVVVAIGLPAAQLARRLTGKRVIFCQVFGFEEHRLETPWMKGVAAVPPPAEQFRSWKALAPGLRRVGVITGSQLTGLVDEARIAARGVGIELVHREVRSDKEMIYTYRRIAPEVEGLWLAPDNRVLSREVIRELLAYSVREGKQVLVFSPELLTLGGLLSAETEPTDIAQRVIARLTELGAGSTVPGPNVLPLTRAHMHVNAELVHRFGLSLPRELAGAVDAP